MAAVRKTYEVVGSDNMLTRIMKFMVKTDLGMVPRTITFKGNSKNRKKGQYSTSEPSLIEAMDARIDAAGLKTDFICVREIDIKPSEVDAQPMVVQTNDGEMHFDVDVDKGQVKRTLSLKRKVGGVSKVQEAGAWLRDNIEGVTARDVSNMDKITRLAAQNNIDFVDLKK